MSEPQCYVAILQLAVPPPKEDYKRNLIARIKEDVPRIENALKNLSSGGLMMTVARSDSGHTAAWVLRTSANSKTIISRIMNPAGSGDYSRNPDHPPDTSRHGDKILVFQLGKDCCINGANTIQAWLDRNCNST